MPPDKTERRPPAKGSGARTATTSVSTTITRSGAARTKPRPPLAAASVFAPQGRRRNWWYTYSCRVCGAFHFGRARELDQVTGVRRAGCGHQVSVMIARTYGSAA